MLKLLKYITIIGFIFGVIVAISSIILAVCLNVLNPELLPYLNVNIVEGVTKFASVFNVIYWICVFFIYFMLNDSNNRT